MASMQIEQVAFRGWENAYRLTLGQAEMIALAEVGPRIISLTVNGGPNLLYVDPETVGGGQGDGAWHIYGGHRIWLSPETEDAYAPDNAPCQATMEDGALTLTTPVDPDTKLVKTLAIWAEGERFVVESRILNTSDFINHGAVWCLTCVAPQGAIAFPWGSSGSWAVKRIQWWANWADHSSQIGSEQYQPTQDLFVVRPTGEEGKLGTYAQEGWVALCRDDATLIKSFTPEAHATYPDDGCSLEVYTCADFIEMETLTPLQTLLPGAEIAQREVWTISAQAVDPTDGEALRKLLC